MPALWPGFTAAMNPWFCGDAEGGEEWEEAGAPTAKKITDEYELAILSAAIVVSQGPLLSGWQKSTMEDGWKTSFKLAFDSAGIPPEGIDPQVTNWIPAATGTVNAWMGAQFNPMPPHIPAAAPVPGSNPTVNNPGTAGMMALASTINDAFHSNQCGAIAGILVGGFIQHLTLVGGIYNGLVPAVPSPIPTPIPFTGVA
mgnify:FL=1